MSKDILNRVAETFLDEPLIISFTIRGENVRHRFLQWLRIRPRTATFSVTGTTFRNMIRIGRLLNQMIPDGSSLYTILENDTEKMAEIIAIAIHNQKSNRPQSLVDLILDNFKSKTALRSVTILVLDQLNTPDFTNSIDLIKKINLLIETSPTGPETIAEPKVISGEQPEELKNIFAGAQTI